MTNYYFLFTYNSSAILVNATDYALYTSAVLLSGLGTTITIQSRNPGDGTSDGSAPILLRVAAVAYSQFYSQF